MLAQETGNSGPIVGPRPQQRGGLQDGVVWIDGINFTYYFSAVTTTQYSYAFVLTVQDVQNVMQTVPFSASQLTNYYHEITQYPPSLWALLGYSASNPLYNNIPIITNATTYKLAARAFCDPTQYLLSDTPNFTTVDSFFNMDGMTPDCDAGGLFIPEIRYNVSSLEAVICRC